MRFLEGDTLNYEITLVQNPPPRRHCDNGQKRTGTKEYFEHECVSCLSVVSNQDRTRMGGSSGKHGYTQETKQLR